MKLRMWGSTSNNIIGGVDMRSIKLKKIIAVAMILVMGASVYGCTNTDASGNKNDDVVVEDLNNNNNNNNNSSNDKVEENEEDIESKEDVISSEENTDDESKVEIFKLYSKDAEQGAEINLGEVEISENESLESKLSKIASILSEKAFNNLPISLTEIKEIDGKKIAVFNLEEIGNNSGDIQLSDYEGISWYNNFFAGSTGGDITQYTLIRNLLQSDYTGEWIDGIEFTYKGSKIEFDHVPELGEVTYR